MNLGLVRTSPSEVSRPVATMLSPILRIVLLSQNLLSVFGYPSFASFTVLPTSQPQAGQSFEVTVAGSDVDTINNKAVLVDFGKPDPITGNLAQSCSDHAFLQLVTPSDHETVEQYLSSSTCNLGTAAPSRLHCGPFTVYGKVGNLGKQKNKITKVTY